MYFTVRNCIFLREFTGIYRPAKRWKGAELRQELLYLTNIQRFLTFRVTDSLTVTQQSNSYTDTQQSLNGHSYLFTVALQVTLLYIRLETGRVRKGYRVYSALKSLLQKISDLLLYSQKLLFILPPVTPC